jgi:hypothetical protein
MEDELKDLFSAETQLLKALPRLTISFSRPQFPSRNSAQHQVDRGCLATDPKLPTEHQPVATQPTQLSG